MICFSMFHNTDKLVESVFVIARSDRPSVGVGTGTSDSPLALL